MKTAFISPLCARLYWLYYKGKDIARGTLRKILKDAGITTEEFNTLK